MLPYSAPPFLRCLVHVCSTVARQASSTRLRLRRRYPEGSGLTFAQWHAHTGPLWLGQSHVSIHGRKQDYRIDGDAVESIDLGDSLEFPAACAPVPDPQEVRGTAGSEIAMAIVVGQSLQLELALPGAAREDLITQ